MFLAFKLRYWGILGCFWAFCAVILGFAVFWGFSGFRWFWFVCFVGFSVCLGVVLGILVWVLLDDFGVFGRVV